MTDRELLELAAMAVGIKEGIGGALWTDSCGIFDSLTDYGDALRLAVKLGNLDLQGVIATAWQTCETEAERMDYVCRAITRLAAERGKAMKEAK